MGIFRIKTNASFKRVEVYYSNFCKIPFSELSSILSSLRFHTWSGYELSVLILRLTGGQDHCVHVKVFSIINSCSGLVVRQAEKLLTPQSLYLHEINCDKIIVCDCTNQSIKPGIAWHIPAYFLLTKEIYLNHSCTKFYTEKHAKNTIFKNYCRHHDMGSLGKRLQQYTDD